MPFVFSETDFEFSFTLSGASAQEVQTTAANIIAEKVFLNFI
jgi:hypothetical protein